MSGIVDIPNSHLVFNQIEGNNLYSFNFYTWIKYLIECQYFKFFFLKGYHKRTLFKLKKGSIPFVFDQTNISQPLSTAESACESPTHPSDVIMPNVNYKI